MKGVLATEFDANILGIDAGDFMIEVEKVFLWQTGLLLNTPLQGICIKILFLKPFLLKND